MHNSTRACALALIATVLLGQERCLRADDTSDLVPDSKLDWLKQSISAIAGGHPGLFDPADLEKFLDDRGSTSAQRFLNQRSQNWRRAVRLAQNVLKWRRKLGVAHMEPGQFPCDLFKMGLIFEEGRAHRKEQTGEDPQTSPVIWLRLGAMGVIIKQLERLSPARVVSFAYNMPKSTIKRIGSSVRRVRQRHGRLTSYYRRHKERSSSSSLVRNMSASQQQGLRQVLKSIIWWLEDWVERNPDTKATLVLDFEDTDFAFASWSSGEFFVRLDDMFPDLFEQVIGFRYKAKLRSIHSPISMFNRIFKSRISSSPETDAKLRFVPSERRLGFYVPRVDSQGFSMLPEYVSGTCVAPDESKIPTGCQADMSQSADPTLWRAIFNEFYNNCKAKLRS